MSAGRPSRSGAAALVLSAALLASCGGGGSSGPRAASPAPTAAPAPSASAASSPPTSPPGSGATATAGPSRGAAPPASPPPSASALPASPPPASSSSARARLLYRLPTQRAVVALTFDAGSDVGSATQTLDLLRARGIHATFGITGAWARANPALVRRMAREGHLVVNHTDRHLSFTGYSTGTAPLSRQQRWDALARADAAIRAADGVTTKPWFRPPYGDRDAGVDRDVAAAGYGTELMWTVDTLGWKGVPPAEVVQRVLAALGPGEIVLMHVGAASTDQRALADVIDRVRARGYSFVRADGRS